MIVGEQKNAMSLNDVRKRFEQLGPDKEFEIAGVENFTVTVAVSIYRSTDSKGKDEIPLRCEVQFGDEANQHAFLVGPGAEDDPITFEDVVEAFDIQPDAPVWEIVIDDEDE
jgi:hypothetical protein